jgi:hypothetical protein
MRRMIVCALFWMAVTAVGVFSAEVSEIYLDDGSVLRAEIVSLRDGVYTLRSASMGEFTLDATRVSQVGSRQADQSAPDQSTRQPFSSPADFQAKVASTQAAIMNDPEAMQAVMAMASDPEFKKFTEDPEAVAALKAGDTAALLKNPQFRAMMEDPKMQGIAARMVNKTKDQE